MEGPTLSNSEQKPFQIGDIVMDNRVVLAPMAGVCNSAFRLTVKEFGAGLVYAEMISDKALNTRNQKRWTCCISMNAKINDLANFWRRQRKLSRSGQVCR